MGGVNTRFSTKPIKILKEPFKFKKSDIEKMQQPTSKKHVDYNEDLFEFVKEFDPFQVKDFQRKYSKEMKNLDSIDQKKKIFMLLTDLMYVQINKTVDRKMKDNDIGQEIPNIMR